ncbi:MAG: alpha-glucuronidase [Lachnospiraceae bacterium]|nr:alpha-glucuronidase [Lachnospiraceae bacterium]
MDFSNGWLDYQPMKLTEQAFHVLAVLCEGSIIESAVEEYRLAMTRMTGKEPEIVKEKKNSCITLSIDRELSVGKDGYEIEKEKDSYRVTGQSESGVLYGMFHFLRLVRTGHMGEIPVANAPEMPLRIMNHWDNMDGSIERGYSGESFFYRDYEILYDERTEQYVRLMASIGINAIVINNVNVHEKETYLITDTYLEQVKQYADLFGRYGIRLFTSVNFAAPMELAGFDNCDPLNESVAQWWKKTAKHIYEVIPKFGGFLVKADSEGRPGPFTYDRTHADGANMLAKALAPYGGIIIWRCFVYNCGQDWRDKVTDRARAAYDNFVGLDGQFDDNVILQIKNGPMDFQVREPVSPLFGGLKKTNMILEVQIAQEYTGQQIDLCYLLPMWREILDFDTFSEGEGSTVLRIVKGAQYGQKFCGMAAVINTGNDYNWTGNDLAAANTYGYGRMTMNPSLAPEVIAREWTELTLGARVEEDITAMLMKSWSTYEKYTAPLGIGWMVTPHYHYGPDVDGYEYDRWGTYHRADRNGLGVDRTPAGTGYTTQYNEPWSAIYADRNTCPEELLLFFHYVRYDEVLKSGKTLIQHIYDTHFDGVEEVEEMIKRWNELQKKLPADVYDRVRERMERQLLNAVEWRDRINTYFYRKSGISDEKGRKIYE